MSDAEREQLETWAEERPRAGPPLRYIWLQALGVAVPVLGMVIVLAAAIMLSFFWPLLWATPFFLFGGIVAAHRLRKVLAERPIDPELRDEPLDRPEVGPLNLIAGMALGYFALGAIFFYLVVRWALTGGPRNPLADAAILAAVIAPWGALSVLIQWTIWRIGTRAGERTVIAFGAAVVCFGLPYSTAPVEFRALISLTALGVIALQTAAPDFELSDLEMMVGRWTRTHMPAFADWIYRLYPKGASEFGPQPAPLAEKATRAPFVYFRDPREQPWPWDFRDPESVQAGEWHYLQNGHRVFVAVVEEMPPAKFARVSDKALDPEEIAQRHAEERWEPLSLTPGPGSDQGPSE